MTCALAVHIVWLTGGFGLWKLTIGGIGVEAMSGNDGVCGLKEAMGLPEVQEDVNTVVSIIPM